MLKTFYVDITPELKISPLLWDLSSSTQSFSSRLVTASSPFLHSLLQQVQTHQRRYRDYNLAPTPRLSFNHAHMDAPGWSAAHVPPIFGFLDPPPEWDHPTHISPLRDAFGRVLPPVNGTEIRGFPFLPRQLPEMIEPWEMEWYFRQSYQLTYDDLRSRQTPGLGALTSKQKNALNNQRQRQGRLPYNSRSWSNKYYGRPTKVLLELVDNLSQLQIDWNTTWTWIPGGGWHQPSNEKNRVPVHHFLLSNTWPHDPSQEVVDAQSTLTHLRARAAQHGLGSWKHLPKALLPSDWSMRVSGTRANGPQGAITNAAAQTGLNNATNQTVLQNSLLQAAPHPPMLQSNAISQGILQGPRIKDDPDKEMITDGLKIKEEEGNDIAANACCEVNDEAIDDAHVWQDDGEDFDYDADDEWEGEIEEKKEGAREVEGFNTEMDLDMDDMDDDGSAVHGSEGCNENDANTGTDKEQLRRRVTQRSQRRGMTTHKNSHDGNAD